MLSRLASMRRALWPVADDPPRLGHSAVPLDLGDLAGRHPNVGATLWIVVIRLKRAIHVVILPGPSRLPGYPG